jgi:transglutaminase-like putative cysteine protease
MTMRILRRVFSAEAMGLILVFAALQALLYGISSSLRNTDTRQFFWVCLLAVLIAFGLQRRKANGILASVGVIALGITGLWILGAHLSTPLVDLGKAVISIVPQIIPAVRSGLPIDTTPVNDALLIVAQASIALSARVQTWMMSLNRNVTVNDALVRNMAWLLILWLISAWMGWFAARRNAIAALLPSIILLALITSYSEYRIETLWLMVLILLLLMGIWNYRNHTAQWERRRVDYSDSIRYDVTQAVLLLSLVIGVVAFITPSISWREIRDYLRQRGENEIAETLGVQQQQVAAQTVPVQKPSLPREHLLSGGYAQSQRIVMTIRTGELPPVSNPVFIAEAPRYYWRSTTYDTYVGEGWITSFAPWQSYGANTPLIPGLLSGYRALHLDVEMVEPEGKLFWSGILFSADVPIQADWRLRPPASLFTDQSTLLQADLFAAVSRATTYRAEAYVPLVTVKELRAASTEYPEAIRERYLKLPKSVPDRVRQLAREITNDRVLAYDKAKAIESYLRTYPSDLEVPAPPPGQDVADFFLFDLKKGYCDYYATAMVVLARLSGLPARFVSGYASGSYDAANAEYVVRELHAHSWAEIYFPEIGWIEFEPTAAQPEIEIPPSEEEIVNAQPDETGTRLLNRLRLETLLYWLSPFAILIFSILLYFSWIEPWLYLRLAPAVAIEKIYRQLYRLGRPLAGERTKAETAYEFMAKLIANFNRIGEGSRIAQYILRARHDIVLLTNAYQGTLFTLHTMDQKNVQTAFNTWKHLRLRLVIARVYFTAQRIFYTARKFPDFIQRDARH